ncbi:Immunoglobulin-like domain, partial [Trinorchestia longiramus]
GRRVLEHSPNEGVIVGDRSLALQGVRRYHRGRYSCTASNIEGDGTSRYLYLDVQFAPVCATPPASSSFGVARGDPVEITCTVASNPRATRFSWSFNNSADTVHVPDGTYTVTANNTSIITYTPVTVLDYGTLLCYAQNVLGAQRVPCVLHIVPAGQSCVVLCVAHCASCCVCCVHILICISNSVASHVTENMVSAGTVNTFKNRLDKLQ